MVLFVDPHNQELGVFKVRGFSNATITENDNKHLYYQGCVWIRKVPKVLDLIEELKRRIDENSDDVNTIPPSFAYPELFADQCTFESKIVHLAKDNSKYHV